MTPVDPGADLLLLRRFEPQFRTTRGEQFYPIPLEAYLPLTDLMVRRRDGQPHVVTERPHVTQEVLAACEEAGPDSITYLHMVREPLTTIQLVQFRARSTLREFHEGTTRFARVGIFARLLDMAFRISLLARGRVPGGGAAAAATSAQEAAAAHPWPVYYGRVVRTQSYTVLQYHVFYAYNDYRSHYHGANDHEGDWEHISVYLSEDAQGAPVPEWVAYAAHDADGADQRRRWGDPELRKFGEHPVVHIGAGSHGAYFSPGEYIIRIEIPLLARVSSWAGAVRTSWQRLFRQGGAPEAAGPDRRFAIAFVDYARGDGLVLGPEGDRPWDARLLMEQPALRSYAGLWGRYSDDPLRGEDAPAGPRFDPDGSIRTSWYDPVGWARLTEVPPASQELGLIDEELARLDREQKTTVEAIARAEREAEKLGVQDAALRQAPTSPAQLEALEAQLRGATILVHDLRAQLSDMRRLAASLERRRLRLEAGDRGDPRAHLRHPAVPAEPRNLRLQRVAEAWSALSSGLLLLFGAALAVVYHTEPLPFLVLFGAFVFAESLFYRWVVVLVHGIVLTLALATVALLVLAFWWQIGVAVAAGSGMFIIWSNVREMLGR